MKKVCFVVHEFGMFKGHGGIASYIYYLCKAILEKNEECEVHVITPMYDQKSDLIANENFKLHEIEPRSVEWQGSEICKLLKAIRPQWVETSDYEGLCLEAIADRNKGAEELKDTAFMVIHHTAVKECFEWSYSIAFRNANIMMQNIHVRELAQYFLCDKNIFPSDFLLRYIQKNDGVRNGVLLRYTYEGIQIDNKDKLYKELDKNFDLSPFKDKFVVSYISRIEGRKNQRFLIDAYIKFRKEAVCETVLIIAGNSLHNEVFGYDEREQLYFSIPKEERENILFYDFVDKGMYHLLCSISNIAIMASTFENFPIAMMEYVYMGIPVMASRYSGCKDYMLGYDDYTSFNPFDVEDLKEKMLIFSRLSFEQQKEIAKRQYENLNVLCNKKSSLDLKFDLYQKVYLDKKKKSLNSSQCFIYSFDDLQKFQEDRYCDCLVVQGIYKRNSCAEFLENNGYIFDNMDDKKIVVVGLKTLMHRTLPDALVNDEMIIIRNIHLKADKRLSQSLNDYLTANPQNYVYIPFFSSQDIEISDRKNRYVDLTNQLFRLQEGIDWKKERVDW